jgi:hypothetical protein
MNGKIVALKNFLDFRAKRFSIKKGGQDENYI